MITIGELNKIITAYSTSTADSHMLCSISLPDIFNKQFMFREQHREVNNQELFYFFEQITPILQVNATDEQYGATCIFINALLGSSAIKDNDDLLQALKQILNSQQLSIEQFFRVIAHATPLALTNAYSELQRGGVPLQEDTYAALFQSVDPMASATAVLNARQRFIPTVNEMTRIITHSNPVAMAEIVVILRTVLSQNIAMQPDSFSAIVDHEQSIELTTALYVLHEKNIRLDATELKQLIARNESFKEISDALIHLQTHAPNLLLVANNRLLVINHPRPQFVLATLKSMAAIGNQLVQDDLDKIVIDPYKDWRSDLTPRCEVHQPAMATLALEGSPDYVKKEAIKKSWKDYHKSMHLMERSVADVSLRYITKPLGENPFPDALLLKKDPDPINPGPLLQFANLYSARYLDLYKAYVSIETKKRIPLIPVTAGQMKLHGFNSENILEMQPGCSVYSGLVTTLKNNLPKDTPTAYDKLIVIMVGNNPDLSRQAAIGLSKAEFETQTGVTLSNQQHQQVMQVLTTYGQLPEPQSSLIKKAHFLMHDFAHMSYERIADQLDAVGNLPGQRTLMHYPDEEERLLMEIRHRVCGDSTIHQNSPGTLGGNPLAYLNVLNNGESPSNKEAEFRNKMYFVYMSNHFANTCILNDETIKEINQWLKDHRKDWTLDMNFITTMRQRGRQYIPPIFRYGANAALNAEFRHSKSDTAVAEHYQKHPNISIHAAMSGTANMNALHKSALSPREYLNQTGELLANRQDNDPRNQKQLNFGSGAAIFDLAAPTDTMSDTTQSYLNSITELGIPVCAGISGTLDQSTAMAGLVGLGVDLDPDKKAFELETIRLAYLAFMLPGGDHTVHEIMQSGKTFGLPYVAGPGYEQYIYSKDTDSIKEELRELQRMRGSDLPEYFFSEAHLTNIVSDLNRQMQTSEVDLREFYQRLQVAKTATIHPELEKKLSVIDYKAILEFFTTIEEVNLKAQLSLLENGQSCRFAKEETGLTRTINIIRTEQGEYKLMVETKNKLANGLKNPDAPVVQGKIKRGKPSWRLDIQEEYFGLTMKVDIDNPKNQAYVKEIQLESALSKTLSEQSANICATDIGIEFEKKGKKKITVYSPKAIGTLDVVLKTLGDAPLVKNKLISDLLSGVKAMHDNGYIHQDLKPQNLLIYQDEAGIYTLKLADFGEAKQVTDTSQYAAGPDKFQSPEMAYYYTNPHDQDKANRDYGQKYYAKSHAIVGRLAADSPEGLASYPQDAIHREAYKAPSKSNDMWAVGSLVHYIQCGVLPETLRDIDAIKVDDPLLQGLLSANRTNRIDIDTAISRNQAIVASPQGRQFVQKQQGQRYYIGINLKKASKADPRQDSRETLGNDIAQYIQCLANKSIQLSDRDRWHMTIGWLENNDSEDTPISAEDYLLIEQRIAPILDKYAQLEFKLTAFYPNHSKLHVHAGFIEETGQLDTLRQEIKTMVQSVAPHVEFKFTRPHAVIAHSKELITKQDLSPVEQPAKPYSISCLDMMYYDPKTGGNVIAKQYSTRILIASPQACQDHLDDSQLKP